MAKKGKQKLTKEELETIDSIRNEASHKFSLIWVE